MVVIIARCHCEDCSDRGVAKYCLQQQMNLSRKRIKPRVITVLVEASGGVPSDGRGECVAHDDGRDHLASVLVHVSVEGTRHRVEDDCEHEDEQLPARAIQSRKKHQSIGSAKDVPVDLFPARVFSHVRHALDVELLSRVLGEVVAKCSQQNKHNESAEEDDHHEAIEYREPVDLVLEEVKLQIAVESRLEGTVRLRPVHRIGEFKGRPDIDRRRTLRGKVDFYYPVPIIGDVQAPMSEYVLQRKRDFGDAG